MAAIRAAAQEVEGTETFREPASLYRGFAIVNASDS